MWQGGVGLCVHGQAGKTHNLDTYKYTHDLGIHLSHQPHKTMSVLNEAIRHQVKNPSSKNPQYQNEPLDHVLMEKCLIQCQTANKGKDKRYHRISFKKTIFRININCFLPINIWINPCGNVFLH